MKVLFFSTTFAATVYFYFSQNLGAHKASSFTLLVPVFAVVFSYLFLKEVPAATTFIGGLFAVSAVYLISRKQKNKMKQ